MKNPCYLCPRRQAGCHGKCEEYQAWAARRAESLRIERIGNTYVTSAEFGRRIEASVQRQTNRRRR